MRNRPIHELVSDNLRRITETQSISLAEIADRAGLDRREFFEVLTGEREGDLDWLNQVATAVGVDTADLLVDHDPQPKLDS